MVTIAIALLCSAAGVALGYLFAQTRSQSAGEQGIGLREKNAALTAQLEEQRVRYEDRLADEERMLAQFEKVTNDTLRMSQEQLMLTAEQSFKKAQLETKGELDQSRLKIENMVNPVTEQLQKIDRIVHEAENRRKEEFGNLAQQLKQVATTNEQIQSEAAQLKNVLRSSSSVRGRWGEMQLRRVVEIAGMLSNCDFTEQQTASDDERVSRADMIVYLPGAGKIAVDSKVPYEAFERGANCDDPDEQKQHFTEHARQLRTAVDQLAKRKYWEMYSPSPGYCVLFVPGDGLLQTALNHDLNLWEYAVEKNVFLASPATLIALLRFAGMQWQQHKQVENAAEIASTGKELYNRLLTMLLHVSKIRKGLDSTVSAFNGMVGSYEDRVVPQARKFHELGIGEAEVIELDKVEKRPRLIEIGDERQLPKGSQSNANGNSFEEYWTIPEAN